MLREATCKRQTLETDILARVCIDGSGKLTVSTGQGFFDHMLRAMGAHSMMDIEISATGDLLTGPHHLMEDCGLSLGAAIRQALALGSPVRRFGSALVPMDEALAQVAIDISGRPLAVVDIGDGGAAGVCADDVTEFVRGLAVSMNATVHARVLAGRNAHHVFEAVFKAIGLCLRQSCEEDPRRVSTPSTKGDVRVG